MPQYLRVRRRRHAVTAPMLRMEGLVDRDSANSHKRERDDNEEAFSGMDLSEDNNLTERQVDSSDSLLPCRKKMRRSVVWRHVESTQNTVQFIDAVLEEAGQESNAIHKLTLIDSSKSISFVVPIKTTTKKTSYKVLNPLERMVDDSLKEVMAGSKTAHDHWMYCRNDPNFVQDRVKYIQWCETANLLHACALWNDVETASEVLLWAAGQGVVEGLIHAVDADGNTPYRTALLVGHDAVAEVIASFGGDDDYVYDMYCLDESHPEDDIHLLSGGDDDDQVKLCHLHGGVGYWDEDGKLVVELSSEDAAFRPIDEQDDDEDSNSENWDGNDYPEDEKSEDSEDDHQDDTFRHDRVQWS